MTFTRLSKLAAAMMIAVLAATLGACGGGDNATDTPTSTAATPTETPTLAGLPTLAEAQGTQCTASAIVNNAVPSGSSYPETVIGTLKCSDGSPKGAKMHAVWHEKNGDKACDATLNKSGTASCTRTIGALTPGFQVAIDLTFTLGANTFTATTGFTPQ